MVSTMGRLADRRTVLLFTLCAGAAASIVGCSHPREAAEDETPPDAPASVAPAEAPAVALGDTVPGLHNVFAVVPGVFSGSGPESQEAFDSLAALGVRTVISVDGARPEIETAHGYGMRYVHIPIGYDGMGPQQALELAKAVESMPGPVYVHCHHGKHRGPTAAAVALVGLGRMSNDQAVEFMKDAGTAESYPGLWACARGAAPYSEADLAQAPGELPEVRTVSGLVEGMVAIDKSWERMKLVRAAGWTAPPDHPDVAPAAEAGILADYFRALLGDEQTRLEGEEFVAAMREAMERAGELESSLVSAGGGEGAERAYKAVAAACADCHEQWRN